MAVDHDKLDFLLRQLPEELKQLVVQYAESLVAERTETRGPEIDSSRSIRRFFGTCDSDENSGDNERIDADLARSYSDPHTE